LALEVAKTKYKQKPNQMNVCQQYSMGEQGDLRNKFYFEGRDACPKCGAKCTEKHVVCGCRMNGDGYGVDEYHCPKCDFKTSFQYDEAGDYYYYEMQYVQKPAAASKI